MESAASLARALKGNNSVQQQRGLRLPSILLTGSGGRGMEVKAKGFGAMAYLDKPVAGERLLECVREALARPIGS